MAQRFINIAGFGQFLYDDAEDRAAETDGDMEAANFIASGLSTNIRKLISNADKKLEEINTGFVYGVSITDADSPYTAGNEEHIVADASAGNITIDLPDATTVQHRVIQIKRIDNSNNTVTVNATGSQTIDGDGSKDIKYQWSNMVVRSNGTNWLIL